MQAIIADDLGQPQEAERELTLAIETCQEPLRAQMQLVRHYLRAKRMSEAIGVCQRACKQHSETAEPWLSLSDLHVANADYDSGRHTLRQGLDAIKERSEKRFLSIKLALLELVHGDRTTGIGILKELASQDAQEVQARSLLLQVREIREDPAATEALIGELRQAEGNGGLWWRLHRAASWLATGNWSSKQQDITDLLRHCIDADAAWSAPVLLLAGMYERLGDFKRVEDTYRQGLAGNPSAVDVADRLLALLERQGRFADAEKVLQQAAIDPRLASAWLVRMALGAKNYPLNSWTTWPGSS